MADNSDARRQKDEEYERETKQVAIGVSAGLGGLMALVVLTQFVLPLVGVNLPYAGLFRLARGTPGGMERLREMNIPTTIREFFRLLFRGNVRIQPAF